MTIDTLLAARAPAIIAILRGVEPDDLLVEEQQEDAERTLLDALGCEPETVGGLHRPVQP